MNWQDQKKRIRRYLRDPDGNIWSDNLLLRLFNDMQIEAANEIGTLTDVDIIRVPSLFQMSYLYDWEWAFADHDGYVYQALRYYDQSDRVITFIWEAENIANTDVSTTDQGDHYSQPWEAWYASIIGKSPPLWVKSDFKQMVYCAFDKEPMEAATEKDIKETDRSWRSKQGKPQYHYRDEALENHLFLCPIPETVSWTDPSQHEGMVLFGSEHTIDTENGTIVAGARDNQDYGIAIDLLEADDNLLIVSDTIPKDIVSDVDESVFAPFLQKYIEYGTLERAYAVNNDGKIESLRDYWAWRKKIGYQAIRIYKAKKFSDRAFRLESQRVIAPRNRRQPPLPDAYPAVW